VVDVIDSLSSIIDRIILKKSSTYGTDVILSSISNNNIDFSQKYTVGDITVINIESNFANIIDGKPYGLLVGV